MPALAFTSTAEETRCDKSLSVRLAACSTLDGLTREMSISEQGMERAGDAREQSYLTRTDFLTLKERQTDTDKQKERVQSVGTST